MNEIEIRCFYPLKTIISLFIGIGIYSYKQRKLSEKLGLVELEILAS